MKKFLIVILMAGAVISCAPKETGITYSNSELGQVASVKKGKIVSLRVVKLKGSNGIGTIGGAVAGGALGSGVSKNDRGKIAGAVGGAIAGAVVGAVSEEAISSGEATEFVIEKADGKMMAIVQTNEENLKSGDKILIIESADSTRIAKDNT